MNSLAKRIDEGLTGIDLSVYSKLREQAARQYEIFERVQDVADVAFKRAKAAEEKAESYRIRHMKLEIRPAIRMEIV